MENEQIALPRGVIIEYDFTAIDGAQILFETTSKLLAKEGIELDIKREALHLNGGNFQGALTELAEALKVKLDAADVAQKLSRTFKDELTKASVSALTPGFKAFVKALTAAGLKVVIATRADTAKLEKALEGLNDPQIVVYSEPSNTYGNCKWDAWKRACTQNNILNLLAVAITGSGNGVKSALIAGLSALAIVHDHTAWQDFGGADVVAPSFNAALASEVLKMLHMA